MAKNLDIRIANLEGNGGGQPERVLVIWSDDQLITDLDTGEQIPYAEYRRRNPDNRVIEVDWPEDC
ncbi:MAG: hypothetical protein HN975_16760 [Anaerolineae bacterium]|jgi:hypothetical protein|nr:hypothetical protein [Anaerolineae bacterium]MBT7991421.1 hypothetical protein [Anaerolineae bacterium]